MPLYEYRGNAENRLAIAESDRRQIALGPEETVAAMVRAIEGKARQLGRPVLVALEGWYGVPWKQIAQTLQKQLPAEYVNANTIFRPRADIDAYARRYTQTDDPGFGIVNTDGAISDLVDSAREAALRSSLQARARTTIVYGCGSAIPSLSCLYDLRFYLDKTRQPLLWQMWDGQLIPFAMDEPKADYGWKEYYYCDFYLLHRQKEFAFQHMDYYLEAVEFESLKLIPRALYDQIIASLVRQPVKEVKIFQPGPWGAYRYKDLWDVPGLECNAWNELAGPELSVLIDVGLPDGQMLNLPFMNLMQYGREFVGPHLHEKLPGMFPMDVWLDDGYFPQPAPAERISMPIHNHPSTDYVKQHFREPLGRYETYYIAEAYEGANTWMGFNEDADLEAWEARCRESERTGKPIPDWKDFIAGHPSVVGDLYLIPPGTTHAHGGNQMVLEMDTCPSLAGTEYSFFMYDFCRPGWDDRTKTMTARPVKMHLDHGFDTDQWRRGDWVRKRLAVRPEVVKWTRDYCLDRYASYGPMPFEIERFHFDQSAGNDTLGRFCHIVTLTVGKRVLIRSRSNPSRACDIELFQSAVVPACFGEYEFVNLDRGRCTVVQMRWKQG